LAVALASVAVVSLAYAAAPVKPPAAKVEPVTDTLFGKSIVDNYRYMEALGPDTISWMKAQGAYTRSVLGAIKPRAALEDRVSKFTGSFGLINGFVTYGGRDFYEERAPGSDNFDLVVHDAKGSRKIVDVAALRAANGGKPFAINYFLASPDGAKVGVGVSEGGSEDASLTVYDAASGAKIAGPLDRAQFGATSWSEDSKTIYFNPPEEARPRRAGDRQVQEFDRRRVGFEIRTRRGPGSERGPWARDEAGGIPRHQRQSRHAARRRAFDQRRAERA